MACCDPCCPVGHPAKCVKPPIMPFDPCCPPPTLCRFNCCPPPPPQPIFITYRPPPPPPEIKGVPLKRPQCCPCGPHEWCQTGFKPVKLTMTPPCGNNPFAPWCAHVEPCPRKPMKYKASILC